AMAVIAALALLFEAIGWLRGTFGNVVYFFLWLAMLIVTAANIPNDPRRAIEPMNDLWGVIVVLSKMMRDTAATFPDYRGSVSIGAIMLPAPLQTFVWNGIAWTPGIILNRLLWVGIAIGISLLAAFFFHRFDPALEKSKGAAVAVASSDSPEDRPVGTRAYSSSLSPLSARPVKLRFGSLLLAELRLMLKGIRWWWLIIALGLIVASLLTPAGIARQLLPLLWVLPLALWSSMGCREARYGTDQLVFSVPHPLRAQLPAIWLAGILITLAMGGGVAIKFGLTLDWMHLLAWGTGVLFIPTLALALGVLSGGNKLFEVVYMVLWYAGPVNRVPYLDFMGAGENVSFAVMSAYWISTLGLFAAAIWARRRQVQT
ncbi:MAG TPA: ABC transporter permease, partial [Anaerolineae bacterium]|nr:ABC transporter permease [Anaerolineae bacterium]